MVLLLKFISSLIFFFQAEDGIRDRNVTGVQTCALPISVERAKDKLVENAKEINGVKVVTAVLPMEPAAAKDLVFKVREALPENMICVVGSVYNDKPMLSVMFSDDMVKDHGLNAGKMIREAAKLIQGGGGGQPHYAQAGGKNKDGLSAAVDKVVELAQL
mgnify:CR=1 FL=1